MKLENIRTIETKNFRVEMDALTEHDVDLSWDDSGEIARKLDSGEFVVFCARARVTLKVHGCELATDYLGNCIYGSFEEFQDHRECGKQNRELAARGEKGRVGSYFSGMIHEVCQEARKQLGSLKQDLGGIYLRA